MTEYVVLDKFNWQRGKCYPRSANAVRKRIRYPTSHDWWASLLHTSW